jgi:hypothetical protein
MARRADLNGLSWARQLDPLLHLVRSAAESPIAPVQSGAHA